MKEKTLILFGDSFLGRFSKGLITRLEETAKGIRVYNCATGGFNTDDGIKRAGYIAQLKPDYVLLSFGANDAAPWKEVQISEKDFEKNLRSIIDSFSGSNIIFFPCPPANDPKEPEKTKEFNNLLSRYNNIVKTVAQEKKINLIDSLRVYGDFLQKGINYHDEDGLHLNEDGYDVLIREVVTLIE